MWANALRSHPTAERSATLAGACANLIVRLSVSAAKIYNRIDTIAGFVGGGKILLNTYQNSGNMSGLQILGNLGSAAAGMSTGLGHLGGAAMKKLDGGFLNFGGCFVAGTPVHVVASPASVLARQIAWSGANGTESYQYLVSSFDSIDVAESFTVAIEEVPLGSRIDTENPEPWTVQRSIASGDEANLRIIVAEVIRDDGTHVGIELLRSVEYINQLGLIAGGRLYMELAELNVAGWVQVHSIEPCPPLCDGPGNLVTGRFVTVQAANIVRATFSDGTIRLLSDMLDVPADSLGSMYQLRWLI